MKSYRTATVATLVTVAALTAVGAGVAAPAQADTDTDAFVSALTDAGLTGIDPATAVAVGQSICPRLVEPGQNAANLAADVAEAIGRPLGPATMFTGLAISVFCPAAVDRMVNGDGLIPLSVLGF